MFGICCFVSTSFPVDRLRLKPLVKVLHSLVF